MEAEPSDSGTKDTFLPNLRVEIPQNDLDAMGRTLVVQVLLVCIEGILDRMVLLFRCGVRANQAYIVELDANFGQPFIHRGES